MCRIYSPKRKEAYIRLCGKTGKKGLYIPLSVAAYIPSSGECYRPGYQCFMKGRKLVGIPQYNIQTYRKKEKFNSGHRLPCRVCGALTVDEICDDCKESYNPLKD